MVFGGLWYGSGMGFGVGYMLVEFDTRSLTCGCLGGEINSDITK